MNTQVNVRLPQNLLHAAEVHAQKKGYGTVQELIRETLREEVFDDELSPEEVKLISKLLADIKSGKEKLLPKSAFWDAVKK